MDRNDGRTKYILRGEGAGSVFVIDEKTGNIHVTKPLDREEKDEYRLIATATDRQTDRPLEPSSQFIIRVQDINDNPPVFEEGPYSATVPEMANIGRNVRVSLDVVLALLKACMGLQINETNFRKYSNKQMIQHQKYTNILQINYINY